MTKPDPSEFIDSLTPEQLDQLNARLAARRAEVNEQPVFCPSCKGIGITFHAGYADSTDIKRCFKCSGQGWVPRGLAPSSADWEQTKATADTLNSVAAHNLLTVTRTKGGWALANHHWNGKVAARSPKMLQASYRIDCPDGRFDVMGTGKLWMALNYCVRGLSDLVLRERIGAVAQ